MTRNLTSPSTAPDTAKPDNTIYLVLEDFGALGCAYRETDPNRADRNSVIEDLIRGEFDRPLKVIAFNTVEGWAMDMSVDIAREAYTRTKSGDRSLSSAVRRFVEECSAEAKIGQSAPLVTGLPNDSI